MNKPQLPTLIESEDLESHLDNEHLLVVDLSKPATHAQYHIPGAVHLEGSQIVAIQKPVMGLLPGRAQLDKVLSGIGALPNTHIVAYDNEGGGWASRFLWTLDVIGHENHSLLNGGLHAWANEDHALTREPTRTTRTDYKTQTKGSAAVDAGYIQARLDDPRVRLLDARSAAEYNGEKRFSARAGRIPGARNLDWMNTMDQNNNLRMKSANTLKETLHALDIKPEHEVITYCQSHHRSSHSYVMLKSLGYTNIKGYPGSWSDWGNRDDTPVEQSS